MCFVLEVGIAPSRYIKSAVTLVVSVALAAVSDSVHGPPPPDPHPGAFFLAVAAFGGGGGFASCVKK